MLIYSEWVYLYIIEDIKWIQAATKPKESKTTHKYIIYFK